MSPPDITPLSKLLIQAIHANTTPARAAKVLAVCASLKLDQLGIHRREHTCKYAS